MSHKLTRAQRLAVRNEKIKIRQLQKKNTSYTKSHIEIEHLQIKLNNTLNKLKCTVEEYEAFILNVKNERIITDDYNIYVNHKTIIYQKSIQKLNSMVYRYKILIDPSCKNKSCKKYNTANYIQDLNTDYVEDSWEFLANDNSAW